MKILFIAITISMCTSSFAQGVIATEANRGGEDSTEAITLPAMPTDNVTDFSDGVFDLSGVAFPQSDAISPAPEPSPFAITLLSAGLLLCAVKPSRRFPFSLTRS